MHARGGHEGIVCSLLLGGASPSAKDKRGDAPLHLAAWRGRAGIASALLLKGADKDALDSQGRVRQPLPCEIFYQYYFVVLWGLDSYPVRRQNTPLGMNSADSLGMKHMTSVALSTEKARLSIPLLPHPCYPHCARQTPLIVAAEHEARGTVDALLMANADTDVRYGENELSSLDSAASHGHVGVLKSLVQHGVDVNAVDSTGYTALHMAGKCQRYGGFHCHRSSRASR